MRKLALTATAAAVVSLTLTGCGGGSSTSQTVPSPSTVTVSVPTGQASAETTSSATTMVTLPEVAGRNGGIVYDELKALGLTSIKLASQDEDDKVVILPENWTAVKIEPAPGTQVRSNQTVVVTLTKKR